MLRKCTSHIENSPFRIALTPTNYHANEKDMYFLVHILSFSAPFVNILFEILDAGFKNLHIEVAFEVPIEIFPDALCMAHLAKNATVR